MSTGNNTIHTCIRNYDETIEMTAIGTIVDSKLDYCMVSFNFNDPANNNLQEGWDNGQYVFDIFYPYLKRYQARTITPQDLEDNDFKSIKHLTDNPEWVDQAVDIIEDGIRLNWNKLTK